MEGIRVWNELGKQILGDGGLSNKAGLSEMEVSWHEVEWWMERRGWILKYIKVHSQLGWQERYFFLKPKSCRNNYGQSLFNITVAKVTHHLFHNSNVLPLLYNLIFTYLWSFVLLIFICFYRFSGCSNYNIHWIFFFHIFHLPWLQSTKSVVEFY